jgi:uncharacterized membrane protein
MMMVSAQMTSRADFLPQGHIPVCEHTTNAMEYVFRMILLVFLLKALEFRETQVVVLVFFPRTV